MKSKARLLFVEDETKKATKYYRQLDLSDILDFVAFVTTFNEAVDHLLEEPPPNIFWVDIQLGSNEYEGIEVLKHIYNICPESLVIVYTAHEVEKQCKDIKLKNLFYLEKDTSNLEEDFAKIRSEIIKYIELIKPRNKGVLFSYPAQIAHIDEQEGVVKVECHINNEIIEKYFRHGPILSALGDDFFIDNWINITIKEKGSEIIISFEKSTEPSIYTKNQSGIDQMSADELMILESGNFLQMSNPIGNNYM
jgi:hypothetical protein